jgi:hypothetical protein
MVSERGGRPVLRIVADPVRQLGPERRVVGLGQPRSPGIREPGPDGLLWPRHRDGIESRCVPPRSPPDHLPAVVERLQAEERLLDQHGHHLPLVTFETHARLGVPEADEALVEGVEVHAPDHLLEPRVRDREPQDRRYLRERRPAHARVEEFVPGTAIDVHPHHHARAPDEEMARLLRADAVRRRDALVRLIPRRLPESVHGGDDRRAPTRRTIDHPVYAFAFACLVTHYVHTIHGRSGEAGSR